MLLSVLQTEILTNVIITRQSYDVHGELWDGSLEDSNGLHSAGPQSWSELASNSVFMEHKSKAMTGRPQLIYQQRLSWNLYLYKCYQYSVYN